jgi:hypothetical protein
LSNCFIADAKDIEYRVDEYLRQKQEQKIDSEPTEPSMKKQNPLFCLLKIILMMRNILPTKQLLAFDFEHSKLELPKSFRSQELG